MVIRNGVILSLDISTKTGWAFIEFDLDNNKLKLLDYGVISGIPEPINIPYPKSYLHWSKQCSDKIFDIIKKYKYNIICIEETSKGSKNAYSQKILEFIHFRVSEYLIEKENIIPYYYQTGEWRHIVGCSMTKEEKKRNSEVRKQHKNGNKIVKDKEGKRIGIIGKKHVNIRKANEIFNLSLIRKDEDKADAILIAYAHYIKMLNSIDTSEKTIDYYLS